MPPLLEIPAAVCAATIFLCWLLSVLTREYSWVDRIWSIVPAVYVALFAWQADWAPRSVLIVVLVTAWAARLTFNFWRKGGYAPGGEDYRWSILRGRMGPVAWHAFNVLFIAGYQNILIFLITLPAWVVAQHPDVPLGPLDYGLAAAFVALLVGETVADEQQWSFHQDKKAKQARGEPITEPFARRGIWAWSRHPNFFCEQAQWWVLTGFAVAAGAGWLHIGTLGAFLLTLLFDGSTRFTEYITLGKYPSYADYQRTVSRWIPLPPRG
jgi:steroid 5-alpha reductase family enzyme